MRNLGIRLSTAILIAACALLVPVGFAHATDGLLLYAADTPAQQLFVLSPTDGSATLVGGFGVPGYMADLAYDAPNDVLYGSTTLTNNLFSINRFTGAATLIGPLGVRLMHALAHDDVSRVLYGVSNDTALLYRIDTNTGQAIAVGSTGLTLGFAISGLAFNPFDNVLYGSRVLTSGTGVGEIYRINLTTGHATFLFSTTTFTDLAFNPITGVLYGIDNGIGIRPDALYTIDLASGTTTLIGLTGLGNGLGLAFAPVPEPGILALIFVAGIFGIWRRAHISAYRAR